MSKQNWVHSRSANVALQISIEKISICYRISGFNFFRYDIMQKCWSRDPDERPSFDCVVRELDAIILTGRSSASHLYLNIHTVMSVSDYRDISA